MDILNGLQIRNATNESADIYFYGEICTDCYDAFLKEDQYPESVKKFIEDNKNKNLNIYINSGGGSVFAGMTIYNMLKRCKGKKTVYVDGCAASIASVIAFVGDEINIPDNAYLMIHKPSALACGDADEMRKTAETLDIVEEGIISVYLEHAKDGVTREQLVKMVEDETWLTGEQAAEIFNVNISQSKKFAAKITAEELKGFKNAPENLTTEDAEQAAGDAGKRDEIKRNLINAKCLFNA